MDVDGIYLLAAAVIKQARKDYMHSSQKGREKIRRWARHSEFVALAGVDPDGMVDTWERERKANRRED